MKINCISCGHGFALDHAYDDYEGPVRCPTCRYLLDITTREGAIKAVRPGSLAVPQQQPLQIQDQTGAQQAA